MENIFLKIAVALGTLSLVPALALAQANTSVSTDASAGITTTSANVRARITASSAAETTRAERAKVKGEQEIDRRIDALSTLLARVNEIKKLTTDFKTILTTNVQNQITSFTDLRAKIDADTDLETLKTDIKSITDSYRIYMLVIPVTRVTAAADRMATVVNMMNSIGVKLQARVNTAKNSGADTASLEATLADLASKLGSAQAHAQAAITAVATLTPDNGDQAAQESNLAAIKNAHAEVKAGILDLAAARKDIGTSISGLAKLQVNANATSSASTSVR